MGSSTPPAVFTGHSPSRLSPIPIDGLAEQRFHSYEETKKWIDSWIASKDESFFRRGIRLLPERWEKVVSSNGQYFE